MGCWETPSVNNELMYSSRSVIGNKTCPTPSHVEQSVDQPLRTYALSNSLTRNNYCFHFKKRDLKSKTLEHSIRNFRNGCTADHFRDCSSESFSRTRTHMMTNGPLNWFISPSNRFASYRLFDSPTHAIKEVLARLDKCWNIYVAKYKPVGSSLNGRKTKSTKLPFLRIE